ncbi:hypothetical protein ACFV2Q_23520 [Streptomyces sp. NPDC059650]|uniref:hypothetical protein n=1 Tax=Streptomyces sp. NPDC059650 TaxID=3346896 RepID=UPI0036A04731
MALEVVPVAMPVQEEHQVARARRQLDHVVVDAEIRVGITACPRICPGIGAWQPRGGLTWPECRGGDLGQLLG